MKCLLLLLSAALLSGCSTTTDGRQTFLGIAKYDKDRCDNAWVLKKKRIVFQKCFR